MSLLPRPSRGHSQARLSLQETRLAKWRPRPVCLPWPLSPRWRLRSHRGGGGAASSPTCLKPLWTWMMLTCLWVRSEMLRLWTGLPLMRRKGRKKKWKLTGVCAETGSETSQTQLFSSYLGAASEKETCRGWPLTCPCVPKMQCFSQVLCVWVQVWVQLTKEQVKSTKNPGANRSLTKPLSQDLADFHLWAQVEFLRWMFEFKSNHHWTSQVKTPVFLVQVPSPSALSQSKRATKNLVESENASIDFL